MGGIELEELGREKLHWGQPALLEGPRPSLHVPLAPLFELSVGWGAEGCLLVKRASRKALAWGGGKEEGGGGAQAVRGGEGAVPGRSFCAHAGLTTKRNSVPRALECLFHTRMLSSTVSTLFTTPITVKLVAETRDLHHQEVKPMPADSRQLARRAAVARGVKCTQDSPLCSSPVAAPMARKGSSPTALVRSTLVPSVTPRLDVIFFPSSISSAIKTTYTSTQAYAARPCTANSASTAQYTAQPTTISTMAPQLRGEGASLSKKA